jgi:acyl dehydratase
LSAGWRRAPARRRLAAGFGTGSAPASAVGSLPSPGVEKPRYWEDFEAGQIYQLGTVQVDEADIVDFGRRWDPQPFHVDPEAAGASPFGGLIASGWHTACLTMRLYVENLLTGTESQGSPGVEQLRWRKPVRPGSRLTATATILDTAPSSSRSDRGTVFLRFETTDDNGDVVMDMLGRALFGRRPVDGGDS